MARKRRESQKENFVKIKEEVERQKAEAEAKLPSIARDSGGSIDKLPVKTKAFQNWLASQQEMNPFIGKHVTAAPEFNVEQKKLDEQVEDVNPETLNQFDDSEYNPNAEGGLQEEDLGESPKLNTGAEKKFIDITITENATRRLSERTNEEIQEYAVNTMRSYHDDPNYEPEIELNSVIENAKILLLESGQKQKKFLR